MTQATTNPTPATLAEPVAGIWLHNPATGEIGHIVAADADGRRLEVDLWLQPGAALARAHIHDNFDERFELRQGKLGLLLEGEERVLTPGDGVVEVPAGTEHDWWNAGDGPALVRGEVEATPQAPGRPAARFLVDDRGAVVARSARSRRRAGRSRTRSGSPRSRASTATRSASPSLPPPSRPRCSARSPRSPADSAATRWQPSCTARRVPARSPIPARTASPACSPSRSASSDGGKTGRPDGRSSGRLLALLCRPFPLELVPANPLADRVVRDPVLAADGELAGRLDLARAAARRAGARPCADAALGRSRACAFAEPVAAQPGSRSVRR